MHTGRTTGAKWYLIIYKIPGLAGDLHLIY
jgi:hypothetical protein